MIKKSLFFSTLLLIVTTVCAQYPTQYLGVPSNRVEVRGQFKMDGLEFLPKYIDSPALDIYADTLGASYLRLRDMQVCFRDTILGGGHKWSTIQNMPSIASHFGLDTIPPGVDTVGLLTYDSADYSGAVSLYFGTTGGIGATISGGVINLSNSTNNDYTVSLKQAATSQYPSWNQQADIQTLSTPGSQTYGIGIGKTGFAVIGKIDLSNGANQGKISLIFGSTTLVTSSAALVFSTNDILRLNLTWQYDSAVFSVTNLTTGLSVGPIKYQYDFVYGETVFPQKVGSYSIYQIGGAYKVIRFRVASNTRANASNALVGTSKSNGYWAGSFARRFGNQLNDRFVKTVNLGSSGDLTSDILARLPSILKVASKSVILECGCNDIRSAVPTATWKANYKAIVDSLTNAGITVYHIVFWEASLDQTILVNYIDSLYHNTFIRTVYTASQACGTPCLAPDGVHPNGQGNDSAFIKIVQYNRPLIYDYRLSTNYLSSFNAGINQNVNATVLVNDNGGVKSSSLNTLGIIRQNGNQFGTTMRIGTTDNNNLLFLKNGVNGLQYNGYGTKGIFLTFLSPGALETTRMLFDSIDNIGIGRIVLTGLTTGTPNIAIGATSSQGITSGSNNVGIGFRTNAGITTSSSNTAIGHQSNVWSSGNSNTAVGAFSFGGVTGTSFNNSTGVGLQACYLCTGSFNIAIGVSTTSSQVGNFNGDHSIIIGNNINFPSNSAAGQVNISNLIIGTGGTGTAGTLQGSVGIALVPSARFHVPAGTIAASSAPFKITLAHAVLMTTSEKGALETDSLGRLYWTDSSGTNGFRDSIARATYIRNTYALKTALPTAASFSQVGAATTTFTVTIGATQANTTYKVNVTPTAALSAALFYVTNKTTTTFDVVYLAGLTGTVTFDWALFP